MKKIVILGAGESGVGAAILARKLGAEAFVSDFGKISEAFRAELVNYEIPFEEGRHSIESFFDADVIIKSPGIPDHVPVIQAIKEKEIPIWSEIEFAARHCDAKLIAITGSNGKTTTTSLIYHILKRAGVDIGLGGNIGRSFARQVAEANFACYVLEISSFQLDDCYAFQPNIAVLTNITPDHLDRYGYSLEAYGKAKLKIAMNQGDGDIFIINDEDPVSQDLLKDFPKLDHERRSFGMRTKDGTKAWIEGKELKSEKGLVFDLDKAQLLGKHNNQNMMAAVLAVEHVVDKQAIIQGLMTFEAIEHRLEPVAEIEGIRFINDSKATNVDAVFYALEAMDRPVIWLVGGVDKGNDYSALLLFVKEKVKAIVVVGEGEEKIRNVFDKPIFQAESMQAVIERAWQLAETGDIVLLSPACASFDLFKNYEDRGEQFKEEVKKLMKN